MLLKKGTVFMQDSDEKSEIINVDGENVNTFPRGSLVFNPNISPSFRIVKGTDIYNESMGYKRVHLYLLVEEKILEGSYGIINDGIGKFENDGEGLHVVASSDRKLGLPKFSKGFLEIYESKGGIDSVFVVYEEITSPAEMLIPKVNRNNIISLRKIRNSYTTAEVKSLFIEFLAANALDTNPETLSKFKLWLNTNI